MKRIFVSSTFRDMQYERDLFHTVITPKLNAYAREYGESVSFCDLRWGVNTSELESEEGARKVLSVCLNEIDRCKPYMVVLLGDRYGWVPDKKLIKDAADKKHFDIDDMERSVTALEIEYGALRDESKLSRTLFYFREFENEIPSKYRSCDENDALRLNELKERIIRIAGDRVRTYKVSVAEDGETILGLDSFADMVVNDIKEMMEDEWEEYANLPLYEKINRSQWNIAKEKSKDFVVFHKRMEELKNKIMSNNHIIVTGAEGSGKTMMMSYIATELKNAGYDVLPIYCGRTHELDSKRNVLKYIMRQMEIRLNCNYSSDNSSSEPKAYSSVISFQDDADIHLLDTILNGTASSFYDFQNRKAHSSKSIGFLSNPKEAEENEYELQYKVFEKIQLYDRTQKKPLYILMDDSDKLNFELLYNKDTYFTSVYHVEHSIHICSFINENNSLCEKTKTFQLTSIDAFEKEKLIKGILNNYGKELSSKAITIISSKNGSSSPKYIGTVLRRLEIMDKDDFDIINSYGDGNNAIIERQIELIRDIPENYYDFLASFMIDTAKYFGGEPLLDALEYLALWEHGLSEDFWKKWMRNYGIVINSLDFSLYINYSQNLIDVFDDYVIRFSSNTLRQKIIEYSKNISLKYSRAIDYLISQNCYFSPEYSYDITRMLLSLERNEELVEYIAYTMRNWNQKQRESIALGIHDFVSFENIEKILSEWIIGVGKKDCLRLTDLVYFLSENLHTVLGNGERDIKKKILSLGIREISSHTESEYGLYGLQILAECYKGLGHETMKTIQEQRPAINNYHIAQKWSEKEIEAIDFYRKATKFEQRITFERFSNANAYWYYCSISNLVLYIIELFKRYHWYLPEQMNTELNEAISYISDYISLIESNLPPDDNKLLLEDLKNVYGYSKRIFECREDSQSILIVAEKEFELAEKINPDHHFNNVNSLINAYLSKGLNDDNMARFSDLFAQRVNYIRILFNKSFSTKKFNLFTAYLLECESLVRLLKSNQSVFLKSSKLFDDFENIIMNLVKLCKNFSQIDGGWENEDTGFMCFYRIKTIIEDAVCIYSAEKQGVKAIELCKELLYIMRYEYKRFESMRSNPDYGRLVDAYIFLAKHLALRSSDEKKQAVCFLEDCLSFIEHQKSHHIGKYGDNVNRTTQALVEILIDLGEIKHLAKAIEYCDYTLSLMSSISDNASPRVPLLKYKTTACLLMDVDQYICVILECLELLKDIIITGYDKATYKEWTYLNNNWSAITDLFNQAIEKSAEDKHSIINIKFVEWITLCADRGISQAQYMLAEYYYRGLHGINPDYEKAYSYYLAAAEQGHALSQYYVAAFLHIGQGVEKNDAKAFEWFKKAADNGSIDAMATLGAFYMNGIGIDKDYSQSVKYLSEACKHDHPLAQNNIAVLYWNGWGVECDYQVAISWFEKAAKNGNKEAQKTLAKIYKDGIHVTKDPVKSFEWYLKLAENNDVDAQKETGENYYYGRGVAVNYEEALRWYLKAAQNGNMLAQYSTGYSYYYGNGCAQDYAKAFEWYLKAAEQGGLSSQCEVGHAYYYGRGISQSYEKAIEWYQKSAEGGYKSGQYALAMCYKNGKGVVQDHSKSFEWFMKAAVQGSAASQNEIGEAYFYGHGVDVCYEKALEWYLKSAKNGNSSAQFNSGYCYRYGKGCEVDYVKAFEWFMRAAEQGSASAECEVGHAYYYGRGVEKSYEKAVEWYQKAADRGNKAAQYALGLCYKNGLGTDKDYTKALNGFMKAAVQGHASSQDEVGIAYYYGRGTTKDHNEAFKWFTKSAESGCSSGQYDLGVCYKNGIGTEQDYTKAFNWFMKAAVQGHAVSQDNVGDAYYYGRGVESDYDKAFEWYMKSAQNGNASAQFDVGYCYKNGIGTEQDYAKAFEWFMKSADRGMAYSQCEVGYAYYFGRGVEQSYENAAQCFLNAAQKGHAEAQRNIGTCYEEGTGVEKNLEQAIFWYQKAIEQGDENAKKALENINSKKEE